MTKYKNTSFLVELLISILVFSISCAILFQVFAAALLTSRDTRNKSQASARIESVFEMLKSGKENVLTLYPGAEEQAGGFYVIYYNDGWNQVDSVDEAAFSLVFQINDQTNDSGKLRGIAASVLGYTSGQDPKEILHMQTTWYLPAT